MTWGLPGLQGLICCPTTLLLKARDSRSMPHIVDFSMATPDQHGCLYLQVVVERQGQGQARVCRKGQQYSPTQFNIRPTSSAPARLGCPQETPQKKPWASAGAASPRCAGVCFTWCDIFRQGITAGEL